MTMGLSPQRALGPHTPCKATTSPSPPWVTGPQPLTIVKAPKCSWLNQLHQSWFFNIAMKRHSTCDETGLTATTIATNGLVKDICVVIVRSNIDKVVPHGNQGCLSQKWYQNIVSAHHQAESVDHANDLHHSWQVPKHHETNAWLVKE